MYLRHPIFPTQTTSIPQGDNLDIEPTSSFTYPELPIIDYEKDSGFENLVTVADFSRYIKKYFRHHANIKRAIAVLQCLEYIKNNIDYIAKEAEKHAKTKHLGHKGVVRDKNNMAIHVNVYQTADEARIGFRSLIGYVENALTLLMAEPKESTVIPNEDIRRRVINLFIDKVDDSTIGCMEARLMPAVRFLDSYLSSPSEPLDFLMNEFSKKYSDSVSVSDVFTYFQEQVAIPLMVTTPESQTPVPLTWEMIKNYCNDNLGFDEEEWNSYYTPFIVANYDDGIKQEFYYLHFRDKEFADLHLANLKNTFYSDPNTERFALALEEEIIKHTDSNQFYSYNYILTAAGYQAYLQTMKRKKAPMSLKGKEKEEDDDAEIYYALPQQEKDIFSTDFCEINLVSISENKKKDIKNEEIIKWYILHFATKEQADEALGQIKAFINLRNPGVNQAMVTYSPESNFDKPFSFKLKEEQLSVLRGQRRALETNLPSLGNFAIKSVRADAKNFIHTYLEGLPGKIDSEEIIDRPKQQPLRTGLKLPYIVKGNGITCRKANEYTELQNIPEKKPQYTPEKKEGFSKAQSVCLGTLYSRPPLFHFHPTDNKQIGFYFSGDNILLSNYNDIPYIGGTVYRRNNFKTAKEAKLYAKRIGHTLFSANVDQVLNAIHKNTNLNRLNESLARLRWNSDGSCAIIIGSDTLSARALAQEYANLVRKRYHLDNNYPVPIYFYQPNKWYHLKEYSRHEQQFDRAIAMAIVNNEEARTNECNRGNYEIALLLPESMIEGFLQSPAKNHSNHFLFMLCNGNVPLARLLFDKIKDNDSFNHDTLLPRSVTDDEKIKAVFFCLMYDAYELADYIFASVSKNANLMINVQTKYPQSTLLNMAVNKAQYDWVKRLLDTESVKEYYGYNPNYNPTNPFTFLVDNYHLDPEAYKKMFLLLQPIKLPIPFSACVHIVIDGHFDLLKLFAKYYTLNVNERNKEKKTLLYYAVINGHADIIQWLLENNSHVNPVLFTLACTRGQSAALDVLIKWGKTQTPALIPTLDINEAASYTSDVVYVILKHCPSDNNTLLNLLAKALWKKNIELIEYLLNIPSVANNVHNHTGAKTTSIHIAVEIQNINILRKLLVASPPLTFPDKNGYVPLHIAVNNNDHESVKLLLAYQAPSINVQDRQGNTPLHLAATKGDIRMIGLLLQDPNINIKIRNKNGHTAFELAARQSIQSDNIQIIRNFIERRNIRADINVNLKDSPSVYAIRKLITSDISFSKEMRDFLRKVMIDYRVKRCNEAKYKTKVVGTLLHSFKLNHTKQEKCGAVDFLLNHDTSSRAQDLEPAFDRYKSALSKGRLSTLFSLIQENKQSNAERKRLKNAARDLEIKDGNLSLK